MAKNKSKAELSAEDILKQMYPDLMTSDDYVDPNAKKVEATTDTSKAMAELQAQIANLQGQLSNVGRANAALSSQTQAELPPQRPVIDYTKAPNPIDDPAGYAQFVHAATQATINYEKEAYNWQNRQAATQSNKTAMLWKDFESKYPDYAKNDERVEVAASRVIAKAKQMGTDADKYMYGNSAMFMQDIVTEMDRLFGKQTAADTTDDDDDDADDNRTGGLFGGAGASAKGPSSVQQPPERYGTLSKEIMAWQDKTGFHR